MDKKKELLYETIVSDLREKILGGTYKPDDRLPTEHELAERYGVSRITSKRALEELKQLGYVYRVRGSGSFVASPLAQPSAAEIDAAGSANFVAVILPFEVSNGSFALSVRGIAEVLEAKGLHMSLFNGLRDVRDVEDLLARLWRERVRGVIYYPLSDRDNFGILNMLRLEGFPLITIDKYFESVPIGYVVSDNESGGALATRYLIDRGHRKIGFVSDLAIESITSIRNRYFGYAKTLKASGIPYDPAFVKVGVTGNEFARSYQKGIYHRIVGDLTGAGITAIFAVNDFIASYLMRAAFEMDLRVPEDLSIVGFDDMDIAKHLQVPLTTVSQDFYSIGRTAGAHLCSFIESGQIDYIQERLPVRLVERESCRTMSD